VRSQRRIGIVPEKYAIGSLLLPLANLKRRHCEEYQSSTEFSDFGRKPDGDVNCDALHWGFSQADRSPPRIGLWERRWRIGRGDPPPTGATG